VRRGGKVEDFARSVYGLVGLGRPTLLMSSAHKTKISYVGP
jgi:hypothetical protein